MIKQMTKIAAMIILAIGLTTNAAAQSKTEFDLLQYIPLTGIETAQGTYDPLTNTVYGKSFVLNNFEGSETHLFTISLDYSGEQGAASNQFPVTGGSWSLVVFRNNVYTGTLFGKVTGGTIGAVTTSGEETALRQMQVDYAGDRWIKKFRGD